MEATEVRQYSLTEEAGYVAGVLDSLAAMWIASEGSGRDWLAESETFSFVITEAAQRAKRLWTEIDGLTAGGTKKLSAD